LSQFTRVTDGQTDRRTDGRTDGQNSHRYTLSALGYMQRSNKTLNSYPEIIKTT